MSKSIKDILPLIIGSQDNWKIKLLNNWNVIWGNLSSKVHLERIDKQQLIIGVHDSCWMQELHMLSHLLLHTINKTIGSEHIKQLRFKKVEKKQKNQSINTKTLVNKETIIQSSRNLNTKEQSALNRIKDPQLSTALKQFLIRCYQEK